MFDYRWWDPYGVQNGYSAAGMTRRLKFLEGLGRCSGVIFLWLASNACAQSVDLPQFLDKHFKYETSRGDAEPKYKAQFAYDPIGPVFTKNTLRLQGDGMDHHTALGVASPLALGARGVFAYNLRRSNYRERVRETEDFSIGISHRLFNIEHRIEKTSETTAFGIPINLSDLKLNLGYGIKSDQAQNREEEWSSVAARYKKLSSSVLWKQRGKYESVDYRIDYKPTRRSALTFLFWDKEFSERREMRATYERSLYSFSASLTAKSIHADETEIGARFLIEKTLQNQNLVTFTIDQNHRRDDSAVNLGWTTRFL